MKTSLLLSLSTLTLTLVSSNSFAQPYFFPFLERNIQPAALGGPAGAIASKCEIDSNSVRVTTKAGLSQKPTKYTNALPNSAEVLKAIDATRQGAQKTLPAHQGGSTYSYIANMTRLGSVDTNLKTVTFKGETYNDTNAAKSLIELMDVNCK